MNTYLMNLHSLNIQAKAVLMRHDIPCDLTQELAAVALLREALDRNLLSVPDLDESLALLASMAANPTAAMQWMTESEPGMVLSWDLSPDLADAAAEILEEVLASLKAQSVVLSPLS